MMKNVLKRAFDTHRGFAAGLALAVVGSLSGGCVMSPWIAQMRNSTGHPLTANEKEMFHSFFGSEMDADIVLKHYFSDGCIGDPAAAAWTFGSKDIAICYSKHHLPDYGSTEDPDRKGDFFHEGMHIVQYQAEERGRKIYAGSRSSRDYLYELDENSRFSGFGIEQQGAMVEDYVRFFLMPEPSYTRKLVGYYQPGKHDLLQKVIEERFPGATVIRLAVEAKRAVMAAEQTVPVVR